MTDKNLKKEFDDILIELGLKKKRRGRGRSDVIPVYVMSDGTVYKHKKNMLASNKTLTGKSKLYCDFILVEHAKDGWFPQIEDMSESEILEYCGKHLL